ncbi:Dabb family protein [Streptomyces sp. NBC_01622]|uniref:Dabb family protein n=1 Tax=Streptomyces sp. NBC_01622 TaxID=2975903 RepID=UPI003865F2E4|nr:Dabb family protein [Streptomyces sp. NBC_01622]
MIVNILRFSFKDGTTEEDKAAVLAAMRRTASVESAAFGVVGQDIGPDDGYTHTYCAAVPDLAALERYMHDPVHLEGDDTILPHIQRITAVRFSDDMDPDLATEVGRVAAAKAAKYPEWVRQLESIPEARFG